VQFFLLHTQNAFPLHPSSCLGAAAATPPKQLLVIHQPSRYPNQLHHPPTIKIPSNPSSYAILPPQSSTKAHGRTCEQGETLLRCPRRISGACRAKPCGSVKLDWVCKQGGTDEQPKKAVVGAENLTHVELTPVNRAKPCYSAPEESLERAGRNLAGARSSIGYVFSVLFQTSNYFIERRLIGCD